MDKRERVIRKQKTKHKRELENHNLETRVPFYRLGASRSDLSIKREIQNLTPIAQEPSLSFRWPFLCYALSNYWPTGSWISTTDLRAWFMALNSVTHFANISFIALNSFTHFANISFFLWKVIFRCCTVTHFLVCRHNLFIPFLKNAHNSRLFVQHTYKAFFFYEAKCYQNITMTFCFSFWLEFEYVQWYDVLFVVLSRIINVDTGYAPL